VVTGLRKDARADTGAPDGTHNVPSGVALQDARFQSINRGLL
jgi:hypothetical protein